MASLSPQFLRAGAALLIALLLQTTVAPHLGVAGVRPELLLAATLAVCIAAGPGAGMVVAFIAGFFVDALGGLPTGLTSLAYCAAVLAVAAINEHASDVWWARSLLAVVATVVTVVVTLTAGSALGHPMIGTLTAFKVGFFVALINALIVPLVAKAIGYGEFRREREDFAW